MAGASKGRPSPSTAGTQASGPQAGCEPCGTGIWKSKKEQAILTSVAGNFQKIGTHRQLEAAQPRAPRTILRSRGGHGEE